jgi:uncharacterized protein (TIGR04255 family)
MPLTLPDVDHRPLAKSPLAVTVFQVRFEQNLSVGDGATGLRIHQQLGGREGLYPRVESQQSVTAQMQISPLGISPITASGVPARGLRMRDDAGTWVLSVMPDFASLETTAYTTWTNDFRERLIAILNAINEHVSPRVEERVGLRYVNRVIEPDVTIPSDFQGLIAPSLLGAVADPLWSQAVTSSQQQLEMDITDDIKCLLRHGTLPRSTGFGLEAYLLDFDLFRQQPREFNVENIVQAADDLNNTATALFQGALTGDYLARLREKELA